MAFSFKLGAISSQGYMTIRADMFHLYKQTNEIFEKVKKKFNLLPLKLLVTKGIQAHNQQPKRHNKAAQQMPLPEMSDVV